MLALKLHDYVPCEVLTEAPFRGCFLWIHLFLVKSQIAWIQCMCDLKNKIPCTSTIVKPTLETITWGATHSSDVYADRLPGEWSPLGTAMVPAGKMARTGQGLVLEWLLLALDKSIYYKCHSIATIKKTRKTPQKFFIAKPHFSPMWKPGGRHGGEALGLDSSPPFLHSHLQGNWHWSHCVMAQNPCVCWPSTVRWMVL